MSADVLLTLLEGVKRTGHGRWLARCPAHEDRHPSLSCRELSDGIVLVHCFAGCGVDEILAAVGLEFDALYPETPVFHRRERRPFNPTDVLDAVVFEVEVAAIAAASLAGGAKLSDTDRERLNTAAARLNRALEIIHGH